MRGIDELRHMLMKSSNKVAILTGAGISTDSGIPDYRGPKGVYMTRKGYKPIQYQEFIGAHEFRQRYWARSMLGYPQLLRASPNHTHYYIKSILERFESESSLITQNVDSLHYAAGSDAIEMHGALRAVVCQGCQMKVDRSTFQADINKLNPTIYQWSIDNPDKIDVDVSSSVNPDGDVEIRWDYSSVNYPNCKQCSSGILKPDVVFFGENMQDKIRNKSFEIVDNANILLIIGTSLEVFSSFRLAKRANDKGIPIVIINVGLTRGDPLATLKIDAPSSTVLESLLKSFGN